MTAAASDAMTPGYAGRAVWGAFIGGAFVAPGDAATFAVTEPATGLQIARVVSGDAALVDRAVAQARRAYPSWRDTPPRERGRLLRLVAANIRAHAEELAELEAREVGKIFGPIACVMRFGTEDEAIEIANSTAYGLTAAICTTDLVRAEAIARRLEAGMVFVNNYMRRAFLGSPFGGVKGSGFGRENALETLHEFVRSKNIRFPSGRGAVPGWPPAD
jgi:acyl-CoA reductase-like NAD-dependent aldehyde dehydrogenase